ncbi:protein of unknown function [Micromonospora citrea]|uniref:Uncharacterized protein n=1 Tax=Micromonospora citrea TaxID=47855 RepID=A0A1C6VPE2_9ACTN|nr:DUF4173 domain-containing protein [Micromonospora citrea]SCL68165.1 protein of unknown function [Micromonospora citrea]
MTQPPPVPGSPEPAGAPPSPGGENPGTATPYLLVMPPLEGAPPTMAWPGPEGVPAWAIPVSIPAGTPGYAVFVPLVSTTAPAPDPGTRPTAGTPTPPGPDTHPAAGTTSSPGPGTHPAAETPTPAAPGARTAEATAGPDVRPAAVPRQGGGEARPTPTAPADTVTGQASPPPGEPSPDDAGSARPAPAGAPTPSPTDSEPPSAATAPGTPPQPTTAPAAPGTPPTTAPAASGTPPQPATAAASAPATAATTVAAPWRPGAGPYPPPYPAGAPGHPPMPYRGFQPLPPRPSFLATRWPGPTAARDRSAPLAVLAGALGLAAFVPLTRTGIGWFLGWLTLTVAVVLAVRRAGADLPRAERWVRAGWAVAALALLAVLAFRNAWWLVTFCVLGALGCATLAIVGGRLVRSILFSLVAAPFAALRGLPWVGGHLHAPANPGLVRRVVGSAAATLAALIVFGALLSSADGAFSVVLDEVIPEVNAGTVFRWIFLGAVGGLSAIAAVYTLAAPPDLSTVDRPGRRRLGVVEWAPVITALTLLFGGFVAVQFTVLFGGERHVLRTAGLSYAEYARSGFWQLVVVTMLTLAVLAAVARWARRDRPVERQLLRILLGLLSALSFVIVVSALSRMYTYQKAYSFTGERLFVMAFELLLGTVFLMILVAGIRWRGAWIPRLTVALAVAMLLSLAVLNPEDYAARRNIARYEQTGKIDAWYLRALSADATPALTGLPDPARRCALSWIADDLDEPDPWYAWNLGRVRAREALDRAGPGAVGGRRDCVAADRLDLPKTRR